MSESWNQVAEDWDSRPDVILFSQKAFNTLVDIININGLSILDFGCGTGLLTERMSPKANRILALDPSEKMISILDAKQLSNVDTIVTELTETSIKSNTLLHSKFDLIVASSVCAFLPNYEKTLELLKTLLRIDGVFVQWDWLKTDASADFGLTKERVELAYKNSGLIMSSLTTAFTFENNEFSMPVLMGVAKNTL